MTFREQLIVQITNGTTIKNGVGSDSLFSKTQAEAIVQLADAIINAMEPEKKEK